MADANANTTKYDENIKIETEYITGSSLKGRYPNELTKAELIRWLKCRQGASLKGKKADLVERVNLYIRNGWDTLYLYNPESGTSAVNVDRIYCASEKYAATLLDNPLTSGYSSNLNGVPAIDDGHIYQYFLVKCDNMKSTAQKHRDKGWNFYCSDKVLSTEFNLDFDDSILMIRGDVAASFDRGVVTGKTKKAYPIHIVMDKFTATILGARCQCKAGFGGYCKHVAAVLFQIMDSQRKKITFTPSSSSKTSTLQTWHQPKVKGQTLVKFADMDFETFNYERDNELKPKRLKTDYTKLKEMCPDGKNCVTKEILGRFCQELSSLGVANQLVEILNASECTPVHSEYDFDISQVKVKVSEFSEMKFSFEAKYSVSAEQYSFYENKVKISTIDEQKKISEKTKGQANSSDWFKERRCRITASNVKEVVVRRKKMPCEKLLQRLTENRHFSSKHTTWGKHAEPVALAQYKAKMEADGFIVSGKDLGLIVNPRFPYVGASPDWLVSLLKNNIVEHGLVEVKSLSKHAIYTPVQAATLPDTFYDIDDKGNVKIDEDHSYYYQIQFQLAVCELDWCDLVIWTPSGMACQRIKRDIKFWEDTLPIITEFYFKHMLPYLVSTANNQNTTSS